MSNKEIPKCSKKCLKSGDNCNKTDCRMWINFEEDLNCSLISIYKNGSLTLEQCAARLDVSFVRISQIEKQALNKLSKRIKI